MLTSEMNILVVIGRGFVIFWIAYDKPETIKYEFLEKQQSSGPRILRIIF